MNLNLLNPNHIYDGVIFHFPVNIQFLSPEAKDAKKEKTEDPKKKESKRSTPTPSSTQPDELQTQLEDLMDTMYPVDSQPVKKTRLIVPKDHDKPIKQKMVNIFKAASTASSSMTPPQSAPVAPEVAEEEVSKETMPAETLPAKTMLGETLPAETETETMLAEAETVPAETLPVGASSDATAVDLHEPKPDVATDVNMEKLKTPEPEPDVKMETGETVAEEVKTSTIVLAAANAATAGDSMQVDKTLTPESKESVHDNTKVNRTAKDIFDLDSALSQAKNHNLLPQFTKYFSEANEIGDESWVFGDESKSDPVEDMRGFNQFLIEHNELPIPYTFEGRTEGTIYLMPSESIDTDRLKYLVKHAQQHPRFKDFMNFSTTQHDINWKFGASMAVQDLNLFHHWLLTNHDSGLQHDYSDDEPTEPTGHQYPIAPSCDHPDIKDVLNSAARVGGFFFLGGNHFFFYGGRMEVEF